MGPVKVESQVRALEAEIRHVRDRQQAMLGTIRVTARTLRDLVDLVPEGPHRPKVTGTLRAMASSLESLLEGWSNVDP